MSHKSTAIGGQHVNVIVMCWIQQNAKHPYADLYTYQGWQFTYQLALPLLCINACRRVLRDCY